MLIFQVTYIAQYFEVFFEGTDKALADPCVIKMITAKFGE